MKHVFVFDPKAFYNQQWKMDNILDNIGQFFRTQEKPDFSIQFSKYRRNALTLIQEEAEKANPDDIVRIYAVGGEEILFDCLNGVIHFPNMELASIPHGESNNFLKIFGENNVESFRDISALVHGEAIPTDIIKWGLNYALNSCYIGMNSGISKNIKELKLNLNKAGFIIFSKIASFINHILTSFDRHVAAREYTITIDDQDYSGNYSLIHVANGPYFEGKLTGAAKSSPDDGLLDIALIKSSHPINTLLSISKYSHGKRPRNCVIVKGKKIKVQSISRMWIQLDNEYVRDTNIDLSVVSKAVHLVAVNNLSYPSVSASGD